IPVTDARRSRDWYVGTLGLKVEFEVAARQTVAVQDSDDFTIFLQQAPSAVRPNGCALYFQVADVEATFRELSERAVAFSRPPRRVAVKGSVSEAMPAPDAATRRRPSA